MHTTLLKDENVVVKVVELPFHADLCRIVLLLKVKTERGDGNG